MEANGQKAQAGLDNTESQASVSSESSLNPQASVSSESSLNPQASVSSESSLNPQASVSSELSFSTSPTESSYTVSRFDKAALFRLVGEDAADMSEMMGLGLKKLAELEIELFDVIAGGDEALIRKVAHKLNGTGRSLRMDQLRERAEKLEYLRPWEVTAVPDLAGALREEIVYLQNVLKTELTAP